MGTSIQSLAHRAIAVDAVRRARPRLAPELTALADQVIADGARWTDLRESYDLAGSLESAASAEVHEASAAVDRATRVFTRSIVDTQGRTPAALYAAGDGLRPGEMLQLRPEDKAQRCKRWLLQLAGRDDLSGDSAARAALDAAVTALADACGRRRAAAGERAKLSNDTDAAAKAFDSGYGRLVTVADGLAGAPVAWAARFDRRRAAKGPEPTASTRAA